MLKCISWILFSPDLYIGSLCQQLLWTPLGTDDKSRALTEINLNKKLRLTYSGYDFFKLYDNTSVY